MHGRMLRISVLAATVVGAVAATAGAATMVPQQLNGTVRALAWQNGYVYVGGDFTNAGGVAAADHVARWNGSWSALSGGVSSDVHALAPGPVLTSKQGRARASNIYAGGYFVNAGGVAAADRIARWNGSAWSALGNTGGGGTVLAILRVGTSVYIGGDFTDWKGIPAADYVARWTGSAWTAVGGGLNSIVYTLAWHAGGLYAGGEFTNAGGVAAADHVARWAGGSWSALGDGLSSGVHALVFRGSRLFAGGTFLNAGGIAEADRVAMWDGSTWSPLGDGVNGAVYALAVRGSTVYVGGEFENADGIAAADALAVWSVSSASWSAVCGGGLNDAQDEVYALLPRGANDLYVGGRFTNAGGVAAADNVARCNAAGWSGL